MSKKIKFLIILITIIALIGLFCGIRAIRNIIILNKTISKLEENIEKDNYYLKTTMKIKDEISNTEVFYKDGVGKNVTSSGIYTWVDGKDAYMVDEENQKVYPMEISEENSKLLVSNEMFMSLIPGYSKNIFERFAMIGSLENTIKSEKINNEKCYKISVKEGNATKNVWVTKSRAFPIKAEIRFSNGDVFEYEYDLKFFTAKLKDIELPDLSEYTFYDYETKEEIQNQENIADTVKG